MNRKVAIVADSLSSRASAPFEDASWEIWGLGNGFLHLRRADRYFEVHEWAWTQRDVDTRRMWRVALELGTKQVIRHASIPDHWERTTDGRPEVIDFPYDQMMAWAQAKHRVYFTGGIAWLVAYALWLADVDEIGLWGVDLSDGTEWEEQKACCEFWVGVASGAGRKITIPTVSPLARSGFTYGFQDYENARSRAIVEGRISLLQEELKEWETKQAESQAAVGQLRARINEGEYYRNNHTFADMPTPQGDLAAKLAESERPTTARIGASELVTKVPLVLPDGPIKAEVKT